MRSGEPSRISLRKRWISLTLRARLKWLAGVIHIAQMLCTGWDLWDTNYFTPPPLLSLLFLFPFPVTSDFAMYIRKPRISGAVLVEARSMTYGDLGAKALLSVLVAVSH